MGKQLYEGKARAHPRQAIFSIQPASLVIRSDCPSPFELVAPTDFAMVSGRQSPQRRVDRASWNQMAHEDGPGAATS